MPPIASRRRIAGLERPLSQYLLELEPERAEGRSWYGGPGAGELVEWRPVLDRAGVRACPNRVAAVYLELAVLVRALEGLTTAASIDAAPDRSSLWAGLFDLRTPCSGRRSTTCARSPPDRRRDEAERLARRGVEEREPVAANRPSMAARRKKRPLRPRVPSRVKKRTAAAHTLSARERAARARAARARPRPRSDPLPRPRRRRGRLVARRRAAEVHRQRRLRPAGRAPRARRAPARAQRPPRRPPVPTRRRGQLPRADDAPRQGQRGLDRDGDRRHARRPDRRRRARRSSAARFSSAGSCS